MCVIIESAKNLEWHCLFRLKEQLALLVTVVQQAQLEGMKVRSGLRESLDLEEQLVHKVLKVFKESKVHKG